MRLCENAAALTKHVRIPAKVSGDSDGTIHSGCESAADDAAKTIERYLSELDRADRQREVTGIPVPAAKVARLTKGIDTLKEKLAHLSALESTMLALGEKQLSLTDPDARAMTSICHTSADPRQGGHYCLL